MIIFLHVPKTAGTSFSEFLKSKFSNDRIVSGWDPSVRRDPNLSSANLVVARGGFDLVDFIRARIEEPPLVVTILRDPVDRTLSQYAQYQKGPNFSRKFGIPGDLTLQKYIAHRRARLSVMDYQARSLALPFGDLLSYDGRSWVFQDCLLSDQEVLELACMNLLSCEFSFLTGLDSLKRKVCEKAGLENSSLPVSNRSNGRIRKEDLDSPTLERIQELTAIDQKLCEFARGHLG